MKGLIIGVLVLAAIAVGFFVARGPEPHIVIPGDELWTVGPLTITSTLMASWFTMVVMILAAVMMTRSMKLIPGGAQNFIEGVLEFLVNQVEEIAGEKNGRKFFMVIATFFLFILMANWLALLPFFKTIGITQDYGHEIFHYIQEAEEEHEGHIHEDHHFLAWETEKTGGIGLVKSGAGTFKFDLHEGDEVGHALDHYIVALAEFYTDFERVEGATEETPPTHEEVEGAFAALQADPDAPKFIEGSEHAVTSEALGASFEAVDFPGAKITSIYPIFRATFSDLSMTLAMAIVAFFAVEFWGFSALGFGYLGKFFVAPWKSPIMTFVGILELLSEFIRVISFAFRLFGNIFAGSVLLLILTFLVPFIAPIGIFGLEVFVGLIQAIVFSLLLLVFAVGAVEHHGEEDHHDGHEGGDADAHTHGHPEGAVQAH